MPTHLMSSDNQLYSYDRDDETSSDDKEDDDNSGIELSFQPESLDEVSSLECSLTSNNNAASQDPDGYKSDDMYSNPIIPPTKLSMQHDAVVSSEVDSRYRTPSPPGRHYAEESFAPAESGGHAISVTAEQLETLTIVSMNIAACVPSKSAPHHWNHEMSTNAMRAEILESDPDIIALQEGPGGIDWASNVFPSYRDIGATYSHADQVILLVRNGIKAKKISPSRRLPAVVAELEWNNRRLLVSSVHLEPFDEGEYKRRKQMETLLQLSASRSAPIIITGDTNMRDNEDTVMEDELNLLDVWKLAGSNPSTQYTWDTIDHRQDGAGGTFNQYYGQRTRQYRRRYDRMYISKTDAVDFTSPPTFELIANHPMTSDSDFLSDHFGMAAILQLSWNE